MKIETQRGHIDDVERHISPPMAMAITIPLSVNNDTGRLYAVYVCTSEFYDAQPTENQLMRLAHEIAVRIDGHAEPK